jgi:transcriptional regulator of arginine metabolism
MFATETLTHTSEREAVPEKPQRQAAILRLVRSRRIPSQERLRELLAHEGFEVTQATLSRDIRALGVVKVADARGQGYYAVPAEAGDPAPVLSRLLPSLLVSLDQVDNLLLVRTLTGGAQPVAVAVDHQQWEEVAGTIAGDDTVLLITRSHSACQTVRHRLEALARLAEGSGQGRPA